MMNLKSTAVRYLKLQQLVDLVQMSYRSFSPLSDCPNCTLFEVLLAFTLLALLIILHLEHEVIIDFFNLLDSSRLVGICEVSDVQKA